MDLLFAETDGDSGRIAGESLAGGNADALVTARAWWKGRLILDGSTPAADLPGGATFVFDTFVPRDENGDLSIELSLSRGGAPARVTVQVTPM